jgi:hypothetical protein
MSRQPTDRARQRGVPGVALTLLAALGLLTACGPITVSVPRTPVPPRRVPTATPLPPPQRPWVVTTAGGILQIAYENPDGTAPQYGALDLTSGYFRLNYGPPSGWGTSIVLLPSFWSAKSCPGGGYCQGAPVAVDPRSRGAQLVLTVTGAIGGLAVTTRVALDPPLAGGRQVSAHVATGASGSVQLDATRTAEAFKPVVLSSMHVSPTLWDASAAYAGSQSIALPAQGWIVDPASPVSAQTFGLRGGTSQWKTNAPTVAITLDTARRITGYVIADVNPRDDNLGFWAATTTALSSWSYDVVVSAAS